MMMMLVGIVVESWPVGGSEQAKRGHGCKSLNLEPSTESPQGNLQRLHGQENQTGQRTLHVIYSFAS